MTRRIKCKTKSASILIFIIIMLMIAGCGRTVYSPMESSDLENVESGDSFYDAEEISVTTEEAIKAKKLKQFINNKADTAIMRDGTIKNILIIGQDRRAGNKSEMRSDSMMIFSINTVTNQINLVSLMRDMYIPWANGNTGIINLTYLYGGAELLIKTIEMNFGIHIDNFIETDFWRFIDLFNAIGEVSIEMTSEEAAALKLIYPQAHREYYDEDTEYSPEVFGGVNTLNSELLLDFCRMRNNIGGDWGRTDRQRRTIEATYNTINNMSYSGLIRLIKENGHFLNTDMDITDMLGYFYWLKKNDITLINCYRLPLEGTYTQEIREEVLHVLVPQIEINRNAAQQYIYGDISNAS